jgi:hypothetical protein
MITLFIEPNKIEEFALFEEEMPHWNKIIKSGIHLCLNISEDDLAAKMTDEFDPLYIAYNSSGTMELPVALGGYIEQVKEDLSLAIDKPNGIFVLNIENNAALEIQNKMGMAVFSSANVPIDLFSKTFFMELDKNAVINEGWKGIIHFKKPLSNSLVISDNYFFTNEDNGSNRGLSNLVPFINAYIPDQLEIEYHITVVAPNGKGKSNDWWVKEYGKLVLAIKQLREYPINIELVLAKSEIHKRRIVSNYVVNKSDKGFDVFYSNNLEKVKEENDFEYLEIFSNLDNSGTKHFHSAIKLINQISKHCNGIANYLSGNKNQIDRSLFGCNPDKTIKNRLLN